MSFIFSLNPVIQALLATIFTWSITLLGAAIVFFFKKINKNILDIMLSISAGVMIAASFWSLLSPAISLASSLNINFMLNVSLGFLMGGVFLYLGDKILSKVHGTNNLSSNKRIIMLITSITLHNIPEGLAIGSAFGSTLYGLDGANLISSWILALGIGIQNFPEGSIISVPLRCEGFSPKKAFFYGQLSGIVEPIAGFVGALLVLKIRLILPFLLSFAAGAMIYVAISELIPESQSNERKSLMSILTLIGFIIMMALDVLFG